MRDKTFTPSLMPSKTEKSHPIFYREMDTSNVTNIMLIDSSIKESKLFYDSANLNTFPILYSQRSKKSDIMFLLQTKFLNGIQRVAFVFHDPSNLDKGFIGDESFFCEKDLEENQTRFSKNVRMLCKLASYFHVQHFDFLACNTLQYSRWKKFYELLTFLTGVTCGASIDKTGNLNYGANWLMENTHEDIRDVYFGETIQDYSSFLDVTTVSQNGGIIYVRQNSGDWQYSANEVTWTTISIFPIVIQNTTVTGTVLTVQLTTNMIVTSVDQYFVCGSNYITFDGLNNTVTLDTITEYSGFIQNGTIAENGFHTISMSNINLASSNSSLAENAGWLCQEYFGININSAVGFDASLNQIQIVNCNNDFGDSGTTISGNYCSGVCGSSFCRNGTATIADCMNNANIDGVNCSGICGANAGESYGNVTIRNCQNTGTIGGYPNITPPSVPANNSGICGENAGQNYGTVVITNCINNADITGSVSAGICGISAAKNHGTVTISSCTNIGADISGDFSTGICAPFAGFTSGTVTITDCTNSAVVAALNGAGICGQQSGIVDGNVTVDSCVNSGHIYGVGAAGICGNSAGQNYGSVTLTNCSNTGSISGNNTAGICGFMAGAMNGEVSMSNCSNSGVIEGASSAGICGQQAAFNSGNVTISYCSNSAHIEGTSCGGICGSLAGNENGTVNVYNSYNTGLLTGDYSGGICGESFGYNTNQTCTVSGCYNTNDVSGTSSGGIFGSIVGYNDDVIYIPTVIVNGCYALGNIANTCGGIFGGGTADQYTNSPNVTLTNSYTTGVITDPNAGLIATTLPIIITVENCYVADGEWSSTSANSALTGVPTLPSNIGSTWTSVFPNRPYILTSYDNLPLYDPSFAAITSNNYVTGPGLIQGAGILYAIISNVPVTGLSADINVETGEIHYMDVPPDITITTNVISYKIDGDLIYDYNMGTFTISYSICFKEGSKILCLKDGIEIYLPIESLKPGTLVKTYKDGFQEINTIGWYKLFNVANGLRTLNCLYELSPNAYPELTEPLVLTGRHPILVNQISKQDVIRYKLSTKKIHDKYSLPCIADQRANVYGEHGMFNIWTFSLKSENESKSFGIYANGLLVESISQRKLNKMINHLNLVE